MATSPDPGNSLVPEEEELKNAICRLTSTEKEIINSVLQRDDEVRSQEKERLRQLKRELDELQEQGIPEGKENEYGRVCQRCRSPLGAFTNKGSLCPWCKKKVCKSCQKPVDKSWLCTLCCKEREIRGESGEWFYGNLPKKKKLQYGSTLLKKLIKRRKSQASKLSKSRHKSEDDSLTSCEIEYVIADTFRKEDKSENEYVVVDQDEDGTMSVSEGNVATIHHFGSEAAVLNVVSEEKENEAPVHDFAFTGASFHDFDSDRNEARVPRDHATAGNLIVRSRNDDESKPKAKKLLATANPFLEDEDFADENEIQTSKVEVGVSLSGLIANETLREREEHSFCNVIEVTEKDTLPQKPVRGVLRSKEDLTTDDIAEESTFSAASLGEGPVFEERGSAHANVDEEPQTSESGEEPGRGDSILNDTLLGIRESPRSEIIEELPRSEISEELPRSEVKEKVAESTFEEKNAIREKESLSDASASLPGGEPGLTDEEVINMKIEYLAEDKNAKDAGETGNPVDSNTEVEQEEEEEENDVETEVDNEDENVAVDLDSGSCARIASFQNDMNDKECSPEVDSSFEHLDQDLDDRKVIVAKENNWYKEGKLQEERASGFYITREEGDVGLGRDRDAENMTVEDNEPEGKGGELVIQSREAKTSTEGEGVNKSPYELFQEVKSECHKLYSEKSSLEKPISMTFKERKEFFKEKEKGVYVSKPLTVPVLGKVLVKEGDLDFEKDLGGDDVEVKGGNEVNELAISPGVDDNALECKEMEIANIKEENEANEIHKMSSDVEKADTEEFASVERTEENAFIEVVRASPNKVVDEALLLKEKAEINAPIQGQNTEADLGENVIEVEDSGLFEVNTESELLVGDQRTEPRGHEAKFEDIIDVKENTAVLELSNTGKKSEMATERTEIEDVELATKEVILVKEETKEDDFERNSGKVISEVRMFDEDQSSKVIALDESTGDITSKKEQVDSGGLVSFDADVACVQDEFVKKKDNSEIPIDVDPVFVEDENMLQLKEQHRAGSYESLRSFQSDDGDVYEALRPHVKITGEVFLGLKYDHTSQRFEVQVHKAKGLVSADPKKISLDPYVKTYLQQDEARSQKKKTKVRKHTLDPVFDEIIAYKIGYEELLLKTLVVSVWHNDKFGQNMFLGEAQIVISSFIDSGYSLEDPTPQQYQLTEKRANRANLKNVGEIVIETTYAPPGTKDVKTHGDPVSGQLVVKCIEAKDLNGNENSNPFCQLRLLPWKSKLKEPHHATEVEAKTVNPYWDKEIIFDNVTFNDLASKVLEVKVLDASVGKKAKFLGAVRLGSGKTEEPFDDPSTKECIAWQKMLQEPNKSIISTLPLRSTLKSLKSSAALPPLLVEREEDLTLHIRHKKSGSLLSQASTGSADEAMSLRATLGKSKLKPQPDQFSLQSFGSMLSIYSDAGGYGSVPISGEILFSIKYDNIAGVFEIHVQKAKNIAAVNKKTRASDPYVKTYLLPDKSKDSKKKTNFKRKTINPEWNEKIKYKIGEKDVMKRTLQVSIWNHEKFGHNDFLGEAQVQISQYVKSGHDLNSHEPVWYTLQELAPVSVGESGYKGALTVGLKYENIDGTVGKLMVDVKEAKDLAAADPSQLSNPFVKSYLLPDRSRKSKRKSTFKKGTLSPTWNEKFEYNGVTLEELEHRVLELTVWDHDLHSNDFLGGTRLGLGRGDENWHDCIGKEASIWNAMLEHPGIWVEYSIPLRDSMTSRKGMEYFPPEIDTEVAQIPQDSERKPAEPIPSELKQGEATGESFTRYLPSSPLMKTGDSIKSKINIVRTEPLVRVGLMYANGETEEDKAKSIKERALKKGTLKVLIKGARNLPLCPNGDSPTTYCKCYVRPRKTAWRVKKTNAFKRSVEPVWEANFEFEGISLDELSTKCVDIIIYNDENVGLGMVRLGPGLMQDSWDDSTDREIEIWTAMSENQDSWNVMTIPFRMQINAATTETEAEITDSANAIEPADVTPSANGGKEDKKLSAKELALQSMGSHATKVMDILGKDQEKKTTPIVGNKSNDNLPRTLSLIREDVDGEEQPRVRFEKGKPFPSAIQKQGMSIPRVLVTQEDEQANQLREIPDEEVDIDAEDTRTPSNLKKMARFGSRDSIASMTSIYSTTSNAIVGTVPIKGQILFGLKYDFGANVFEVHIFRAKDIAAVDARKEISDPYAKVYLLPDKTKGSKKKTKVRHKTLNPEWNEILDYKISIVELRTRTLMVSVWNYDRLGRNIFLGEVLFPLNEKIDQGLLKDQKGEWHDLQELSTVKSPVVYKGELTIGLTYEDFDREKKIGKGKKEKKEKKKKQGKGRILIHVIKGEDLPAGDDDGLCDPYCKFYLLPLKQAKTKRKTPVIKKARSAYWDYHTEYDVDYDDLPELGIEFTVYDWDQHSTNDFLGCTRLNLGGRNGKWDDARGVERDAWLKLINEPNVRHEFVIPLRSNKDFISREDIEI